MSDHDRNEARRKQALRDLERVGETSEVIATSSLRRAAEGVRGHFAGADAEEGDSVELWGRRIGRALSLVVLIVLAVYLAMTYL